MTDPMTAIGIYLVPGLIYGALCFGLLVRDGVPVSRLVVWRGLIVVVGAWPLVLLMQVGRKVKRAVRSSRSGTLVA